MTREHFENLKKGDWVAVTGHRDLDQEDDNPVFNESGYMGFMLGGSTPKKRDYSGVPVQIQAVSFPFICVADHKSIDSLDLRKISVAKVSKQYVQAMLSRPRTSRVIDCKVSSNSILDSWRQVEIIPDRRLCPVCNEGTMTESIKEGEHQWKLECPECGFVGMRPGGEG